MIIWRGLQPRVLAHLLIAVAEGRQGSRTGSPRGPRQGAQSPTDQAPRRSATVPPASAANGEPGRS